MVGKSTSIEESIVHKSISLIKVVFPSLQTVQQVPLANSGKVSPHFRIRELSNVHPAGILPCRDLHHHSFTTAGDKFGAIATATPNCYDPNSVVNSRLSYLWFSNVHMFRQNEEPELTRKLKHGAQERKQGRAAIQSKKALFSKNVSSLCLAFLVKKSQFRFDFSSNLVLKLIKVLITLFNCFRNKSFLLTRFYFRFLKIAKEMIIVNISNKLKICSDNYLKFESKKANLLKFSRSLSQMADDSPKVIFSPRTPSGSPPYIAPQESSGNPPYVAPQESPDSPPYNVPQPSPARSIQIGGRGRGDGRGRGRGSNIPPGIAGDGQMRTSRWGPGYSPVGGGARSCRGEVSARPSNRNRGARNFRLQNRLGNRGGFRGRYQNTPTPRVTRSSTKLSEGNDPKDGVKFGGTSKSPGSA